MDVEGTIFSTPTKMTDLYSDSDRRGNTTREKESRRKKSLAFPPPPLYMKKEQALDGYYMIR